MKKVGLFINRPYVDAHWCFVELARQLVCAGYLVDLYYVFNPYTPPPQFFDNRIRVLPFPQGRKQLTKFWSKDILGMSNGRYSAVIGTPIDGAWLAYRMGKKHKIPFYYLADEIFDEQIRYHDIDDWCKTKKRDIRANYAATATISLGQKRYVYQKQVNGLDADHPYFILPNAPAGMSKKQKSNYFRDILGIDDKKPLILFIGTLNWSLAQKVFDQTRDYKDKSYHLVFHGRTKGLMGKDKETHPFIHLSQMPVPSYMLNYAVSSADIGLVLYDKDVPQESNNGLTGGKIATYLKNELPLIAGNLEDFKVFEENKVGLYWDGVEDIDTVINRCIAEKGNMQQEIGSFYKKNYQYDIFFARFREELDSKCLK